MLKKMVHLVIIVLYRVSELFMRVLSVSIEVGELRGKAMLIKHLKLLKDY